MSDVEVASGAALTNAEQVKNKIAELQTRLKENSPLYESILQTIHKALVADEAVAWILTEEEIGVIVAGLSKKKNIVIATTGAKNKTSSGKSLKDITVDDI